jgi:hypothetical protein
LTKQSTARHRKIWPEWLAIGLVLLGGLAVRVYHLGFPELAGDEGFSYVFIQRSYAEIVTATLAMGEPHPVGSYFIFKAWSNLAGSSEFALRFPSAWFGVMAIGLTYRLGRELRFSAAARIGAAMLIAVGPFSAFYSREMRMYGMLLALTLASTLLAWISFQRFSWRIVVAYIAISWLALNTHYYAGFVLVAQNLFVLSSTLLRRSKNRLRALIGWIVAQIGVLISSSPWLIPALSVATTYSGAVDYSPDLVSALFVYLGSFLLGQHFPLRDAVPALIWLCFALIVVGLAKLWLSGADQRIAGWLLALYLFVPLLLAWANGLNRPVFSQRYAIAALGPLYLILAEAAWGTLLFPQPISRALRAVSSSAGACIIAAALAGLQGYLRSDKVDGHPQIWEKFIHVINRYTEAVPASSVRIALNYPDPVFTYYHHRLWPQGPDFTTLPPRAQDIEGARAIAREWRAQGAERVLLQIVDSFWDGRGVAATALASEFAYMGETYTGQWIVKIYSRPGPGDLQPLNVQFVNGPLLRAAYVRADPSVKLVEVYFSWDDGVTPLRGSEKFFIHVSEQANPFALIGQRDEPLVLASSQAIQVDGLNVHGYGVPLNKAVPAGRYDVRIGLYDPAQTGMPRLLTSDGRDAVVIASFTVE